MAKVSIILPSRNERFLARTITDLCERATGDIEIIAVLDGCWSETKLPEDPRLIVLHFGEAQGMRQAINAGARVAKGEYLLKLDAHCAVAEGFDEVLSADCDDDWVVIPRRYALDAENWCIEPRTDAKYPIDAHYLGNPYARPGDPNWHMHGNIWNERREARQHVLIDDEMSSQGSCWFMSKAQWNRMGELDFLNYGSFINEFQEIGNKTWLGGGRVVVNKKTWYAHLYKGRRYGRGWPLDQSEFKRGADFTTEFWMNDRWSQRTRDLRWLIEHFAPVPSWPADLDVVFRRARELAAC